MEHLSSILFGVGGFIGGLLSSWLAWKRDKREDRDDLVSTAMELVQALSTEVDRLSERVSQLQAEVESLKAEKERLLIKLAELHMMVGRMNHGDAKS